MSIAQADFAETVNATLKPMRRGYTIGHMGNDLLRTTGKRIRLLSEERGISLKEIAQRLGISQSFLSQILRGKKPPLEVVIHLARLLDTTTDYLLLVSDNHTRQTIVSDDTPHYFSPEADEVARIVDELPPFRRDELLAHARIIAQMERDSERNVAAALEMVQERLTTNGLVVGENGMRVIRAALIDYATALLGSNATSAIDAVTPGSSARNGRTKPTSK